MLLCFYRKARGCICSVFSSWGHLGCGAVSQAHCHPKTTWTLSIIFVSYPGQLSKMKNDLSTTWEFINQFHCRYTAGTVCWASGPLYLYVILKFSYAIRWGQTAKNPVTSISLRNNERETTLEKNLERCFQWEFLVICLMMLPRQNYGRCGKSPWIHLKHVYRGV